MMNRFISGIDIGGTRIRVSLATPSGKILAKREFPSGNARKVSSSINQIHSTVLALISECRLNSKWLLGIGVAVPGAINIKYGRIEKSPNLSSWEGFPLKKVISQRFRVPVTVENDANAAAIGERHFGSGKGIDDFLYLTISTGIGSGIFANGSLVRGTGGIAGEIGHMTLVKDGFPCNCGKRGCLEAYSSGTAIGQHAQRAIQQGARSSFFKKIKLSKITGHLVSEAAKQGDKVAIQARELAADYLGIGLANVINLLNPKRIILGGGVMEYVGYFWLPMISAVKREAWPMAFRACKIVRSRSGKNVGDLGAIALVLENSRL